ncbi:FAD-binding dehydrogenase [Nocardia nova]|uniref:FAD-binding dehydrogenase n=1 Tax=Nocardia nova TaxID=37330 RepID=A0A2S6AN35_9NOCA|nr:FAD-dependent oxidoreductase [Nocardia nova]PPJ25706.1 FAD-binding dehydrogenase [Nocardia nova]PPJ36667.1 FAD-binding dehydrogenase [Nocardia nova]
MSDGTAARRSATSAVADHRDSESYDLIVVGAGGAGLSAAVSAAEQGLRVIVFEAEDIIGGSTQLSAGMLTAAGTSMQRAIGIDDTVDRMFQHYMDLNQWRVLPGPTRAFCEAAAPTVEWLTSLGLEIPGKKSLNAHQPGVTRAGVEDTDRGHVPRDQGYGLIQVLDAARRKLGVELVLRSRVEDLLFTPDGAIRGVLVDEVEAIAPNVVVATGGLTQNPALRERFLPDTALAGDALFVVSAPGARGDHIGFSERHHLALYGQGWGLQLVTAEFQTAHHWQSGFPPPARVHVDNRGLRCMDEDAPYAVGSGIVKDCGGSVWAVFDEAARTALPTGYKDWTADRVLQEVEKGVVRAAGTIADLACAIDVDSGALVASIDEYNEYARTNIDPQFLRHLTRNAKGETGPLASIGEAPYYAVKMVPAELACSHTGLRIDARARVLSTTGGQVAGLYAAGEAAGGVLGERYVGGGNSVAHAIVFGRLAGLDAAQRVANSAAQAPR